MVKGWLVGDRTGKESHLNVCLQAQKDRACIDRGTANAGADDDARGCSGFWQSSK